MQKFAELICKNKKLIIGISLILLVISFIGMKLTKVNYDILVYLPEDIETIKGQKLLTDDFNMGSYSIAVVNNLKGKEILKLEDTIKEIRGVNEVISLYDVLGTKVPVEMLPNEIREKLHKDNTDLLFITFSGSTSSEETLKAVEDIRNITKDKISQGGMSSMVLDTMNLSEKEIFAYIVIAVILCIIVLELTLDSFAVPFILLANIGSAILFNLGTNIFLGQISYITKSLVAVLQLGVTTDFSIFLYHSYEKKKNEIKNKEKAMCEAIKETFASVTGSSLTTIAGFLVLCTMQLTLGKDLGIVMAKGVLIGVVTVLTLFPSLLLIFDKMIDKTKHKLIMPKFLKINEFIVKHNKAILVGFLILILPFYLANSKIDVYYKLDKSLPSTLESIKSNSVLKEKYNIVSPEIILINKNLQNDKVLAMTEEIEKLKGIDFVLSLSKVKEVGITENMLSDELINMIENEKYQLLIVNSNYDVATKELNDQIDAVNSIVKKYDKEGIIAGEGPLTKDLVTICDIDFRNVNYSSIVCIFLILFIVLKSFSLPFLLIIAIEFAIFANMSVSYFSGTVLPFIAPIVLGTIQLGATIDYAILLTTTYLKKRQKVIDKKDAMIETLNYCGSSILTSGMCFFAATFGVGLYSDIEMIGSLCTLISRGAIISMVVVITVLPSILLTFDGLILKTTKIERKEKGMKKIRKVARVITSWILIFGILLSTCPIKANALEKQETVYTKLNSDGNVMNIIVNEQLLNDSSSDIEDYTELKNIINLNGEESFDQNDNSLVWKADGKDILYQGTINKDLPISIEMTYTLDGKQMSVSDILGKSGKVEITLKYKNNSKQSVYVNGKNEILYTPFVVTMGTVINNDNNTNIEVKNGKVISNGTKSIIAGISAPGLYESLKLDEVKGLDEIKISYETISFELSSIYSVVTPKLIESNDLDVFNKMDIIYNQVDSLQENMNALETGANQVKGGSETLKNSLSASINGLSDSNRSALTEDQILLIKDQTVTKVQETFTDDYKTMIASSAWQQVKNSMASFNDKTIETYVKDSVTNILTSYLGGETNLMYYGGCVAGNIDACTVLSYAGYDVSKVAEFQNVITTQVAGVASNTSNYIAENVSKSVAISASESAALKTASEVSETLAPSIADQVKTASIEKISESLGLLYDGVNKLDEGIGKLSDGISQFNEQGINKISSLVNNNFKLTANRIKLLTKLSEEYSLFAGKLNNTKGDTKFIMVIDSVKLPKPAEIETPKDVKTTFWDRIKNLFKED